MTSSEKHVLIDIQDVLSELRRDIKSLECIADLGDGGLINQQSVKLDLLIPLLDNLTDKLNIDVDKISEIIQFNT